MYFCVFLCIVCFVTYSVLFVCMCVLNYCHRVATQLQLNISYRIISYHINKRQWKVCLSRYLNGLTLLENVCSVTLDSSTAVRTVTYLLTYSMEQRPS